jgi:hypothetical protein
MAPSSTTGSAKRATGWAALLLAAQMALSPVMASPMNVATVPDARSTEEELGKQNRGYSLSFYAESSCNGEAFLLVEGGQSTNEYGVSGCSPLYDPYTAKAKCARSVKYLISPWFSGREIALDLLNDAECNEWQGTISKSGLGWGRRLHCLRSLLYKRRACILLRESRNTQ